MPGCMTSLEHDTLAGEDDRHAPLTGRHAKVDVAASEVRTSDGA